MHVLLQADAVSCQSLKQVAEKLGASLTSLVLAGNSLTAFHLVLNVIMVSDCLCWGCGGRGGGWNGWGGDTLDRGLLTAFVCLWREETEMMTLTSS